jgi:hypothetical protein
MMQTCLQCGDNYDDARCSTICPHESFLSEETLARKDAAIGLLGKTIRFAHQPEGPNWSVMSVSWDGMVMLADLAGEFAPHLFTIVEQDHG